jgi:ABC-2 type transport system ATP-binding protein
VLKIKNLSRGQRARAGTAGGSGPSSRSCLLLDEPSSGLDPVVRRDILGAIIRTIADEGRTVLFSSHLLDEVERVADRVAILHQGRILLAATLDQLKEIASAG